jgi:hypothetical protein
MLKMNSNVAEGLRLVSGLYTDLVIIKSILRLLLPNYLAVYLNLI